MKTKLKENHNKNELVLKDIILYIQTKVNFKSINNFFNN